ncbi:Tyrosine--tRNA ligase [Trichinella pseudospiralis]
MMDEMPTARVEPTFSMDSAVQPELVEEVAPDSFLAALCRFIARRDARRSSSPVTFGHVRAGQRFFAFHPETEIRTGEAAHRLEAHLTKKGLLGGDGAAKRCALRIAN